jgi:hypothetical protein
VGIAFAILPAFSTVPHYFSKGCGMALGLRVSGSSLSRIIWLITLVIFSTKLTLAGECVSQHSSCTHCWLWLASHQTAQETCQPSQGNAGFLSHQASGFDTSGINCTCWTKATSMAGIVMLLLAYGLSSGVSHMPVTPYFTAVTDFIHIPQPQILARISLPHKHPPKFVLESLIFLILINQIETMPISQHPLRLAVPPYSHKRQRISTKTISDPSVLLQLFGL